MTCYADPPHWWAWHNTHVTKKIPKEQRITKPVSLKKERTRRKPARPPTSLKDKISNLHLLLRVPSFSRWPLQVRFFCEDVYEKWQCCNRTADGSIRDGIKVLLDLEQPKETINDGNSRPSTQAKGKQKQEALGKGGIKGLDVGYNELKDHIEKRISLFAEDKAVKCAICAKNLGPKTAMALVCNRKACRTVSHTSCLATKFIEDEGSTGVVTPTSGTCPGCKEELLWIDMIKELSLRLRGERIVAQMMKKPSAPSIKGPKTKALKANNVEASQLETHSVSEQDTADPDEDLVKTDMRNLDASDESLSEGWQYQDDEDDNITTALSGHDGHSNSDEVKAAGLTKGSSTAPKLPAVIEDSEWDDADFLE